ncbi:MAG: DUF2254 domain-containing protein [Myxococcota bacterium]
MRLPSWYGWLADRWDALRTSYWFLPVQMALAAGVLALVAIELDRAFGPYLVEHIPWLTRTSAAGARSVLTTIAGSMMTVTSVVFSITIVALTLTSSQFGPRLLRSFLRDRASQLSLGTFVATFFYSLLVLQAVGTPEQVPTLATALGVLLAGTSLFVLIFFIHHAASSIQASSVIAAVVREIDAQLPQLFPESIGGGAGGPDATADVFSPGTELERIGLCVASDCEGYVRFLDEEALIAIARECDVVIHLRTRPGRFVTQGSELARVVPAERMTPEAEEELRAACILGDHRTATQDLGFLTGQLAEMAVRALSPGVNDPKTAVDCVHRMGAVIAQLATRRMPSGLRTDEDGALRVTVEPTRFDDLVAVCLDPVRRHGANDAQVVVALFEAIEMGARCCLDDERRGVLAEHAREIREGFMAARRVESERDAALVEAAFGHAMARVEGSGLPGEVTPG